MDHLDFNTQILVKQLLLVAQIKTGLSMVAIYYIVNI